MESHRKSGTLLLLGGVLIFAGINARLLPPETFPIGVLMAPLGILMFLKGHRGAIEKAEERARRAVAPPKIRSVTADAFAQQQARRLEQDRRRDPRAQEAEHEPVLLERDTIELDEDDEGFAISSDVSFPIEVQERGVVAEEIRKLQRLRDDGVIDDQEFSAAKAKLLK